MVDRQGTGDLNLPSSPAKLVIATRQSRLALWQAHHVRDRLLEIHPHCDVVLLGMTTTGDEVLDRPLNDIGGKGLFTKELEVALADGRADLAVHSLKDVPMDLPEGFSLAGVMRREDPRDAFVSNRYADLASMPAGARVGTSSLRRAAQLAERWPALEILPVRGNLDTRLAKLDRGEYDAILLAAAGLKRLGLAERIRQVVPPAQSLPAPGQGALGIETLTERADVKTWIAPLTDRKSWLETTAERAVSRALGGSCRIPLAAYAVLGAGGTMKIDALLAVEGGIIRRSSAEAPVDGFEAADRLGAEAAHRLR
jgi:hydroxymethylbilane synthase